LTEEVSPPIEILIRCGIPDESEDISAWSVGSVFDPIVSCEDPREKSEEEYEHDACDVELRTPFE
jgi:hypothetical protein